MTKPILLQKAEHQQKMAMLLGSLDTEMKERVLETARTTTMSIEEAASYECNKQRTGE